jgi:hypothetical protein
MSAAGSSRTGGGTDGSRSESGGYQDITDGALLATGLPFRSRIPGAQ